MIALDIWATFAIAEMARHCYVRKKKKRSPNKAFSLSLRTAVALGLLFFLETRPMLDAGLTYLFVGWWIHDYPQNLIMGVRPIYYLNDTGPIDRFQNKYPDAFVWFCWKTILMVGLVGAYYFNYQ